MPTETSDPTHATDLATQYFRTRDPQLREQMVQQYAPLVHTVASKFRRPGVPQEDLVQTAWLALFRALERFDPVHGAQFATYAVTCMAGEIKRYFRDHTWSIRAPRHLRDLAVSIASAEERLRNRLHREPTPAELAEHLRVQEEDLLAAMELGRGYEPRRLDDPVCQSDGGQAVPLAEVLGRADPHLEAMVEHAPVLCALKELDERGRRVLELRFLHEQSQQEVADVMGVSQMQISRIERRALRDLRHLLDLQSGADGKKESG